MNHSKQNDKTDFLLTFSDLILLLKKGKSIIVKAAVGCALLFLAYALMQPLEYRVEATFKEKGKSQSGLNQSISALLMNGDDNQSDALIILRSRMLIEKLVKSYGLQASISQKNSSKAMNSLRKIKDNVIAEYVNIKKKALPFAASNDYDIIAENVEYDGESFLSFSLFFHSCSDFSIFHDNGQELGQGKLDVPFTIGNLTLTLVKISAAPIVNKAYHMSIEPLGKTAQEIGEKFTIEPDRLESSLLKISYVHPNRHQAVAHTNALMNLYKDYISQEHQSTCNVQLEYLQKKQAEMGKELQEQMQAHAKNLSSDLSDTGFADYTTAMNFLTDRQHNYNQRVQAIDLEMHWLNQARHGDKADFDKLASIHNPDIINQITKEIRQLKHESRSLELALSKIEPSPFSNSHKPHASDFQGLDLSTAKELYLAYSRELDNLDAQIVQHSFVISQINLPDFEISSLSTVLNDPISTNMISKASEIILALKDQDNRTLKEQERLKAELAIQKTFFITHLTQTVQLIDLRKQLMKEKIRSLQEAHLSLAMEQINILENQMDDYIAQRLTTLQQERILYDRNLSELRAEMAGLPKKWLAEQMIQQHMDINQNMIEQISKLVESKNLSLNLEKTQSKSIDDPLTPIHPRSPKLLLFTLIGAIIGAVLSIGWILGRSIARGIPASPENLQLNGQHVSGSLSLHNSSLLLSNGILPDSDLDTLRRIISFAINPDSTFSEGRSRALLLLCNRSPNYAEYLAELMFKMGFKVLIVDLCFDKKSATSNKQGLLQYLEGSSNTFDIQHCNAYDIIPSGGMTRFANELLASDKFKEMILQLEKNYDWIIAASSASPVSTDAATLLTQFSKSIVTINDESLQEVRERILSNSHKGKLSFVFGC